jgi:hypothetical protein
VPLSEREPEEKACAIIAFKQVSQYIARASDILVATNNNLACNICSQHFTADSNRVLLIQDEDPKELEVNGWIPLTKCKFSAKIGDIVLSGHTWRLQPTVVTANEQPGWNEFSLQMETFLVMAGAFVNSDSSDMYFQLFQRLFTLIQEVGILVIQGQHIYETGIEAVIDDMCNKQAIGMFSLFIIDI